MMFAGGFRNNLKRLWEGSNLISATAKEEKVLSRSLTGGEAAS